MQPPAPHARKPPLMMTTSWPGNGELMKKLWDQMLDQFYSPMCCVSSWIRFSGGRTGMLGVFRPFMQFLRQQNIFSLTKIGVLGVLALGIGDTKNIFLLLTDPVVLCQKKRYILSVTPNLAYLG
jgi:hypothetical protein